MPVPHIYLKKKKNPSVFSNKSKWNSQAAAVVNNINIPAPTANITAISNAESEMWAQHCSDISKHIFFKCRKLFNLTCFLHLFLFSVENMQPTASLWLKAVFSVYWNRSSVFGIISNLVTHNLLSLFLCFKLNSAFYFLSCTVCWCCVLFVYTLQLKLVALFPFSIEKYFR